MVEGGAIGGKGLAIATATMLLAGMCSACFGEEKQRHVGHCKADEQVYFSCATQDNKVLSICGAGESGQARRLYYRFGLQGVPELAYPDDVNSGKPKFFYNHYVRPRADYFEVGFVNQEFEYRVFEHYDADLSPDASFGVSVQNLSENSAPAIVTCATPPRRKLSELSQYLPCNEESALGCGN